MEDKVSKVQSVSNKQSGNSEAKAKAMAKEMAKTISPVQIEIKGNGKKKASLIEKSNNKNTSNKTQVAEKEAQKSLANNLFAKIKGKLFMAKKSQEEEFQDLSRDKIKTGRKRKVVV